MDTWSEEDTLDFIAEYKSRTILWNSTHPWHYHKLKRNDAWVELSQAVNRDPKECKKKWDNLLASLRRERSKLKTVETEKGVEEVYFGSWYAFEALRFALDKYRPRESLHKGPQKAGAKRKHEGSVECESGAAEPNDFAWEEFGEDDSLHESDDLVNVVIDETRETQRSSQTAAGVHPARKWTTGSTEEKETEHAIFGKHVAAQLSKMSSRQAITVMGKISCILTESRLEDLSNSSPT